MPVLSPVAWNLSYRYPVHRISEELQPREPGDQPTHLVVYRDRQERVQFLEINVVTQRLIELLKQNPTWTGRYTVTRVAEELDHPHPESVLHAGRELLRDLSARDIIIGTRL